LEQTPSIGRIVHYVPRMSERRRDTDVCYAAMITRVTNEGVDLTISAPGSQPFFACNVLYEPRETTPGTWRWPSRT